MIKIKEFPPGMPDGWIFEIDKKTVLKGILVCSDGIVLEVIEKLLEGFKKGINDENRAVAMIKLNEIKKMIDGR